MNEEERRLLDSVLTGIDGINQRLGRIEEILACAPPAGARPFAPPAGNFAPDISQPFEPPPLSDLPQARPAMSSAAPSGYFPAASAVPPGAAGATGPATAAASLPAIPARPAPPPRAPVKPHQPFSFEKTIWPWLSRIGVGLIFFSAVFFLKIAYDHLPDEGRMALGILVGIVFLAGGELMDKKDNRPLSRALSGGGIMLLYLTFYASFSFFKPPLIGQIPAFLLLILATATGVAVSLRHNSRVILGLSLIGGFLTPLMVSTGQDNQVALLTYILILDSSLIAIAYWRRWRWVSIMCFLFTVLIFGGWAAKFYVDAKFWITLGFATAFFLCFAASEILHSLVRREATRLEDLVMVSANAAIYFGAMYAMMDDSNHEELFGALSIMLGIFFLLETRLLYRLLPSDNRAQTILTAWAVVFVTMAIPLQLDYESVTIIWAAEAVALSAYGLFSRNEIVRWGGLAVLLIALLHLIGVDADKYQEHLRNKEDLKLIAAVVITWGSVLASLGGCIYFYRRYRNRVSLPANAMTGAYLLEIILGLFFLLVFNHYLFHTEYYPNIYSSARRGEILNLSLIVGLYSSAAIALGILYSRPWLRYFGLPLLGLTLLKVIFYDMSGLPLPYRMVSFAVLGGLFVGLSFLYGKYRDRIEGIAVREEDGEDHEAEKSEETP